MDTTTYIRLPDGTWAELHRSMDYGEVVIILILVAFLVFYVYDLWKRHAK